MNGFTHDIYKLWILYGQRQMDMYRSQTFLGASWILNTPKVIFQLLWDDLTGNRSPKKVMRQSYQQSKQSTKVNGSPKNSIIMDMNVHTCGTCGSLRAGEALLMH